MSATRSNALWLFAFAAFCAPFADSRQTLIEASRFAASRFKAFVEALLLGDDDADVVHVRYATADELYYTTSDDAVVPLYAPRSRQSFARIVLCYLDALLARSSARVFQRASAFSLMMNRKNRASHILPQFEADVGASIGLTDSAARAPVAEVSSRSEKSFRCPNDYRMIHLAPMLSRDTDPDPKWNHNTLHIKILHAERLLLRREVDASRLSERVERTMAAASKKLGHATPIIIKWLTERDAVKEFLSTAPRIYTDNWQLGVELRRTFLVNGSMKERRGTSSSQFTQWLAAALFTPSTGNNSLDSTLRHWAEKSGGGELCVCPTAYQAQYDLFLVLYLCDYIIS